MTVRLIIKRIIHRFPYLPAVILALILRLWGLGLNPVGISHDEIHDLINSKSMAITGQWVPGTVAGIVVKDGICDGNCVFGELASVMLLWWMKIFPLSMVWSKIPFVMAGVMMVYLTGKLMENISKKREVGMLAAMTLALSPWAIMFGRTAYENLLAFACYLGSLYFWTKRNGGNKEAGWATVLGLLGSLAYFGAKVIWWPLMGLGAIYWGINNKKKWSEAGGWIVITTLLVLVYGWYLGKTTAGVRLGELNWQGQKTSEIVNLERKNLLQLPEIISQMVSNKVGVTIREIGQKYLNVFSLNYFLSDSEAAYDNFSIPGHGYVYLIEVPLILWGLVELYSISKLGWLLIVFLIMLVPLPGALNNYAVTYALRAGLMFPLIAGLTGVGWFKLGKLIGSNKRWLIMAAVMIPSVAFFELLYWYRLPLEKSAGYVFHERVLVKYINELKKTGVEKINLTVNDPIDVMYNYAFYTGKYNKSAFAKTFNQAIEDGSYLIEGINFSRQCPKTVETGELYIWERARNCVGEPNSLARISEARDGGARFFILEDKLCQNEEQTSYPYPRKISDFEVEKMNVSEFCQKWINKP